VYRDSNKLKNPQFNVNDHVVKVVPRVAGKPIYQQWEVVYYDDLPKDPKKGELHPEYGLYIERPFYIVSDMPTGRYLDNVGDTFPVIKHRNGNSSQVWTFKFKLWTIENKANG